MKLFYLVLVFTVFTISCARPTARDVDSGKQKLNRVITFIESRQSENLESLADTDELRKLYETESGKSFPSGVNYVKMQDGGYRLYCYIRWRNALWYTSKGSSRFPEGWSLDNESR